MASIWRHPNSRFWSACFTDESGKQVKRTTKETDAKKARKVADAFEEAVRKARAGELTRAAAVDVINDLMERTHGQGIDNRSVKQYFADYVTTLTANGTKASTLDRYRPIFDGFLNHIGPVRAGARLGSVTTQELTEFRNAEVLSGKTHGTAMFALKVLNGVFADARRQAVILHNPVQAVKPLPGSESEERQPFTDSQVASILAVADEEWRGMVLFAYHTGIRLNDCANLTWKNIVDGKVLRFREAKTAHRRRRVSQRDTSVVMAEDLRQYLGELPHPNKKDSPLFPSLFGKKPGSAGGLSNAFARLMEMAGIERESGVERTGKGRRFNALSFHSLRHTMISRLANSDAPEAVTKAMSGHSTDEAHARYVHLDEQAQTQVVAKAPRLWKPMNHKV